MERIVIDLMVYIIIIFLYISWTEAEQEHTPKELPKLCYKIQ